MQQPKDCAYVSQYFNCEYRITWAHILRIYQSDEYHEARHFFESMTNGFNEVVEEKNRFSKIKKNAKVLFCSKGYNSSNEIWMPKIDGIGMYLMNQKKYFPVGTVFFVTRRKLQICSDGIKFDSKNESSDSLLIGVASVPIDNALALNKKQDYLRLCPPSCEKNPILEEFQVDTASLTTGDTQ